MDSNNRRRILFLPKWYPNKVIPANGNFIEVHAAAVSRYADVAVLFTRAADQKETYKIDIAEEPNLLTVKVYFRKPKGLSKLFYPFYYFKGQKKGYAEILKRQGQPDLCHVHVLKRSAFFALYLKIRKGIPYIISEHWSGYTKESSEFGGIWNKLITKYLAARSAGISTVSSFLQKAMKSHGINGKYQVVPNAVDTELFNYRKGDEELRKENKLLHISTLDEKVKRVSGIIHSFNEVLKHHPELELHLVGDGKDRQRHEKLVKELNLESKVFFHGDISRAEVAGHLKDASALILFSAIETQSVVMLEAFCCGTPVIAPAVGGIPEHLNEERGILLLRSDQKELTAAIDFIVSKKAKFIPEAIAAYGMGNFNYATIGKQFSDMYESVLSKSK